MLYSVQQEREKWGEKRAEAKCWKARSATLKAEFAHEGGGRYGENHALKRTDNCTFGFDENRQEATLVSV